VVAKKGIDVLKYFGFNSPSILTLNRQMPTSNTLRSVSNAQDGSLLLRNDLRGAMAVDSKAATVGQDDDMMISYIAQKSGAHSKIVWNPGFSTNFPVTPWKAVDFEGFEYTIPPVTHVAAVHQFWSGELTYTFEIVASTFHRGTIGISWVPYRSAAPLNYKDFPNRFMTTIMDVTETKTIDFTPPFAPNTPNLFVKNDTSYLYNPSGENECNGTIFVYEINPLKSSGSSSTVDINVYVRAANSFKLYYPTVRIARNYQMVKNPFFGALDEELENLSPPPELIRPTHYQSPNGGGGLPYPEEQENNQDHSSLTGTTIPDRNLLYFGEESLSVKDICSKPMLIADVGSFASNVTRLPLPDEPTWWTSASIGGGAPGAFMGWFAPAYLAQRGGKRWKVVRSLGGTNGTSSGQGILDPSRTITTAWLNFDATVATALVPSGSASDMFSVLDGTGGYVLVRNIDNATLEVEVPYLSLCRFTNPRHLIYRSLTGNPSFDLFSNATTTLRYVGGSPNNYIFGSCADDYSLHGYFVPPKLFVRGGA
jgi:hypothetical protein